MDFLNTYCATCTSKDRQMFPLPMQHIKLISFLYNDLMLNSIHKICWECKHFVMKMVQFRKKAERAQKSLTAMTLKKAKMPFTARLGESFTVCKSLSNLRISKGITLEIQSKQEPKPVGEDLSPYFDIKPESDMNRNEGYEISSIEEDPLITETVDVKPDPCLTQDGQLEDPVTYESSGIKMEYDNQYDGIFEVFYHKIANEKQQNTTNLKSCEGKWKSPYSPDSPDWAIHYNQNYTEPSVNHQSEMRHRQEVGSQKNMETGYAKIQDRSEIANATLMSLLTRQSSKLSFPPQITQTPTPKLPTIEVPTLNIRILENRTPATDVDSIEETETLTAKPSYTEEIMTEEEREKWWESKKEKEYYAKSIEVFRCKKCIEPFFTRRSFLGHAKMHTDMYGKLSCDVCELRFHTEGALIAHKDTHYRLLKCTRCAHMWDSPNSMRRHCNIEHSIPIDAWKCELCPQDLGNYRNYLTHIRNHATAECPHCGKLISFCGLKTHIQIHKSVDRSYMCQQCDKKFKIKAHLKSHILHVHSDANIYCAECDKRFKNIYTYNSHMKHSTGHVSKELLTHKCSVCSKAFASARVLQRHFGCKHSGERKFPCQQCNQKFKSSSARSRHRKEVHESFVAPRNKICDYCGKAFQTKSCLATHINTHTGARPFVCQLCGADFGHQSALYLHRRYKHNIQKKAANTSTYTEDA